MVLNWAHRPLGEKKGHRAAKFTGQGAAVAGFPRGLTWGFKDDPTPPLGVKKNCACPLCCRWVVRNGYLSESEGVVSFFGVNSRPDPTASHIWGLSCQRYGPATD